MRDEPCPTFVSDCHVRAAIELINHTWDASILSALRLGPTRRNELLTRISGVSDKSLTHALRRLQASGLVARTPPAAPPTVNTGATYQLTALGGSLAHGPLAQLARWAADNHAELLDASAG